MKTTEIFVEQVLIGFIVLGLIVALTCPCYLAPLPGFNSLELLHEFCSAESAPCRPVSTAAGDEADVSSLLNFGIGAFLVGVAYFLGLVYDRIADTICGNWEKHNRLQVALRDVELADKAKLPGSGDPFPEDRIRHVVQKDPGLVEWADYLRSRMRLTRSLTTLMPALGVTAAVLAGNPRNIGIAAFFLIIVYIAVPVASKVARDNLEKQGWSPPGTRKADRQNLDKYWTNHRKEENKSGKHRGVQLKRQDFILDPAVRGVVVTALASYFLAVDGLALYPAAFFAAGATGGLTILVGWVWWRVSRTFLDYLKTAYMVESEFANERFEWDRDIKASNPSE